MQYFISPLKSINTWIFLTEFGFYGISEFSLRLVFPVGGKDISFSQ